MLLSSVLAPFAYNETFVYCGRDETHHPLSLTWDYALPDNVLNDYYINSTCYFGRSESPCLVYVPQLWVQTASSSLVCILGNASFDVNFEFISGSQKTVRYQTTHFEPVRIPKYKIERSGLAYEWEAVKGGYRQETAYKLLFDTLTTILSGSVTMSIYDGPVTKGVTSISSAGSPLSQIMHTELAICEELAANYWNENPIGMSRKGVVSWQLAENYGVYEPAKLKNLTKLPKYKNSTARCRNATLRFGIEDLMNNITISLLGIPEIL